MKPHPRVPEKAPEDKRIEEMRNNFNRPRRSLDLEGIHRRRERERLFEGGADRFNLGSFGLDFDREADLDLLAKSPLSLKQDLSTTRVERLLKQRQMRRTRSSANLSAEEGAQDKDSNIFSCTPLKDTLNEIPIECPRGPESKRSSLESPGGSVRESNKDAQRL
eukprot:CAMPEP_0198233746 /NCGR_PEP_ID=MMETSP1445-20131203/116398_1 /TAXON_ID=36898 /ORGANISM="Pyramimonas sp., Strain CCMP2087" /LENGTH=163 /DNA_ID=CAMNT_0043914447 /DNA_START=436 /DNA_END=923 /DNA_ORIENTATION=-